MYVCVSVRIDAATVQERRERNSMHWIRRSVGCRVASHRAASRHLASPGLATLSSLESDVTAARFIASVNLRRLTSRRVSGYLSTYPPTYLSTYPSAALTGRRAYTNAPRLSPLSSALFPCERSLCARATHAPIETVTVSRCTLRYTRRKKDGSLSTKFSKKI